MRDRTCATEGNVATESKRASIDTSLRYCDDSQTKVARNTLISVSPSDRLLIMSVQTAEPENMFSEPDMVSSQKTAHLDACTVLRMPYEPIWQGCSSEHSKHAAAMKRACVPVLHIAPAAA